MRIIHYVPSIILDWIYVYARQLQKFLSRDRAEGYLTPQGVLRAPVIIIPGIYEPWQFMKPVAQALYSHGHPVHMLDSLGYNTGSIPDMARRVHEYIAARQLKDAVIVAHSKGGLIGKYYLAHYNSGKRVRKLIAINTPFSGSVYATYLPIPGVRMFAPTAQYVRELLANNLLNASVTSIYSKYDPNIPSGSALPGATNIVIDTIGHFRIVNHPLTHRAILAAI